MGRSSTFAFLTMSTVTLIASPVPAQVARVFVNQVDNGGQGDLAGTVTNDVLVVFVGELHGQ